MPQILLRRDTAANWTSVNPILAAGEIGIETDTGKAKLGDGTTAWVNLPYFKDKVFTEIDFTHLTEVRELSHDHPNKTLLDSLTNAGDGSLFLADDGNYKQVTGSGGATTFDELADTPATKIADKYIKVSADGTTLEYADGSAPVNIDGLTVVDSVQTLATLTTLTDGDIFYVQNYWSNGDDGGLGGGFIQYQASNTDAVDGGITLPTADGTGRFVRIGIDTNKFDPHLYGAIGVSTGGTSLVVQRPVSDYFSTLADAQKFYPWIDNIDDEIDWVAWMSNIRYLEIKYRTFDGSNYYIKHPLIGKLRRYGGRYYFNKELDLRHGGEVWFDFNECTLVYTGPSGTKDYPKMFIRFRGENADKTPLTLIDDPTVTYINAGHGKCFITGLRIRNQGGSHYTWEGHRYVVGVELCSPVNSLYEHNIFRGDFYINVLVTATGLLSTWRKNEFGEGFDLLYFSPAVNDFNTTYFIENNEFQNYGRYAIVGHFSGTGIDCHLSDNSIEGRLTDDFSIYADIVNRRNWCWQGIMASVALRQFNGGVIEKNRFEDTRDIHFHLIQPMSVTCFKNAWASYYISTNATSWYNQAFQDKKAELGWSPIDDIRNSDASSTTDRDPQSLGVVNFIDDVFNTETLEIYTSLDVDPLVKIIGTNVSLYKTSTDSALLGNIKVYPDPLDANNDYTLTDFSYANITCEISDKHIGYPASQYYFTENNTKFWGHEMTHRQLNYGSENDSNGEGWFWNTLYLSSPFYNAKISAENRIYDNPLLFLWRAEDDGSNEQYFEIAGMVGTDRKIRYHSKSRTAPIGLKDNLGILKWKIYDIQYRWYDETDIQAGAPLGWLCTHAAYTTADITNGSDQLTNVANTSIFEVGKPVIGAGIPVGTTVTAIDSANNIVTMSAQATADYTAREIGRIEWKSFGHIYETDKFSGTTAERPNVTQIGFRYFDTDLGKPIFWSGSQWVDANGTAV